MTLPAARTAADRYLGMVKRSLVNDLYLELEAVLHYLLLCQRAGQEPDPEIVRDVAAHRPEILAHLSAQREVGQMVYWPGQDGQLYDPRNLAEQSHTMIGRKRLDHLHACLDTLYTQGIPGDLIETGVWRGGATIFMRAHLAAYGETGRRVWVADSFDGLPEPSISQDSGYDLSKRHQPILAISEERVRALFARYDLLDDQVHFLPGWFRDTLAAAPIERLALLRLDGDLYESTMDALEALYDKVVPGGFIIADDYGALPPCRQAIDEFRARRGIKDPLEKIDWTGVAWRKQADALPARRPGGRGNFKIIQKPAPQREECRFYHRVDLPGGPSEGEWDLRPNVDAYFGGVTLAGRSVLEIGPASGFLSFHMERQGAAVTAVEPSMERLWDCFPLSGFDRAQWRDDHEVQITRVRNSFWYLHHLNRSSVRLVEADPETLPEAMGEYDIGLLGAILLHTRSPFSILEGVAARVRETMIVTDLFDPTLGDLPVMRLIPWADAPTLDTWWSFSPAFLVRALECLGFPYATVTYHTQLRVQDNLQVPMCTVVAHRTAPAGYQPMVPAASVAPEAPLAPIDARQIDLQIAAARDLRWLPDSITVEDDDITIQGWALTLWDAPEAIRFTINGTVFTEVEWPLPSPDLKDYFGFLPHADAARFRCRYRLQPGENPFPDGVACVAMTGAFGDHRRSYRTAWYLLDPALEAPLPDSAQIARLIGTENSLAFRMGGATIIHRIDRYLQDRFDRGLSSFRAVLDWNCGAGQLSRYLTRFVSSLVGVDTDAAMVAQCQATLSSPAQDAVRFTVVGAAPPTDFADGQFDLVIGLSVLTEMDAATQDAWLVELQRIVEPGGLLLLSVRGFAQSSFYRCPPDLWQATQRAGLLCQGDAENPQAVHSQEYIFSHWGQYFDILDSIGGLAGGQDMIVLRRRSSKPTLAELRIDSPRHSD